MNDEQIVDYVKNIIMTNLESDENFKNMVLVNAKETNEPLIDHIDVLTALFKKAKEILESGDKMSEIKNEEIIKIEDYEKYWQKGGAYVLPVEVFNELFYGIERLQQKNKELKKYCCKRNDCGGRLKENNKFTDSEILTKLEKWLEEKKNSFVFSNNDTEYKQARDIGFYFGFTESLDKLRKLKCGDK